jgi:EAL domain-containing protein (putative c-di-GMP-specific phosphodiesterase class I)
VKIDRSFVAGIERTPTNLAIIRAIIGLAREIGINVVAEGIETPEQAETLKAEGCTFLQGYHFGRPRPFTDVAANLAIDTLKDLRRPAWPDLRVGPQERTVHNPL